MWVWFGIIFKVLLLIVKFIGYCLNCGIDLFVEGYWVGFDFKKVNL